MWLGRSYLPVMPTVHRRTFGAVSLAMSKPSLSLAASASAATCPANCPSSADTSMACHTARQVGGRGIHLPVGMIWRWSVDRDAVCLQVPEQMRNPARPSPH